MSRASIEDPLKVFRFRVVIDGFVRAGFKEVTGFERTTDAVEYREGGMNETPQKSAGLTKYSDLVLKRGQIVGGSTVRGDDDFLNWVNQVHQVSTLGNAENYRKDFDVQQYTATNRLVRTWRVFNAFPTRFKPFGDLQALSSDDSVEELTITHEGFIAVR